MNITLQCFTIDRNHVIYFDDLWPLPSGTRWTTQWSTSILPL